jgi:hypothetical protein
VSATEPPIGHTYVEADGVRWSKTRALGDGYRAALLAAVADATRAMLTGRTLGHALIEGLGYERAIRCCPDGSRDPGVHDDGCRSLGPPLCTKCNDTGWVLAPVVTRDGRTVSVTFRGETRACSEFSAAMVRNGADADAIAIEAWEQSERDRIGRLYGCDRDYSGRPPGER